MSDMMVGIFSYKNGNKYDGSWKENKKDGDGIHFLKSFRNILL